MSWTVEKVTDTFEAFKQRVAEDEQFKAIALDKPSEAFEQLAGLKLPPGVEFILSENEDGQQLLQVTLLPAAQAGEGELDEAELEQVTGGFSYENFRGGIDVIVQDEEGDGIYRFFLG